MMLKKNYFMPASDNNSRRRASCYRVVRPSGRPCVRPSVNTYCAWRDFSSLSAKWM